MNNTIELADGISWSNADNADNRTALQWICENAGGEVLPLVDEQKDVYGRPVANIYETDTARVIRKTEYIHSNGSWARKGVIVSVEKKGGDA